MDQPIGNRASQAVETPLTEIQRPDDLHRLRPDRLIAQNGL
jgi:hypothetical protein